MYSVHGDDEGLAFLFADTGSSRAMETLFRRHLGPVYSLTRRYFAAREDAEEAASESFLRAFRALRAGQFRGEARFRTWLARIATNVCLERLRQPRLPTLGLESLLAADLPAAPREPRDAGRVAAALERLPEAQRLIVTLCDLEGYTAQEAAEIVGRSLSAVKSLHARARRALRDEIARQEREEDAL